MALAAGIPLYIHGVTDSKTGFLTVALYLRSKAKYFLKMSKNNGALYK